MQDLQDVKDTEQYQALLRQYKHEKRRAAIAERALKNRVEASVNSSFVFYSKDREEKMQKIINDNFTAELQKAELETIRESQKCPT